MLNHDARLAAQSSGAPSSTLVPDRLTQLGLPHSDPISAMRPAVYPPVTLEGRPSANDNSSLQFDQELGESAGLLPGLCMLYKIFHNPEHPLHSELPNLFQPVRMTRNVANSHSLSFCPVRCNTVQYSRSFIPAFVKSWNDLPEEVVECSELQRFKTGANRFLLNLQV